MTKEDKPTHDTLYVKFERKKGVFNCPLCEILDGVYQGEYTIEVDGKIKKYQKGLLKVLIQKRLDAGVITDFCIQKRGTPRNDEVQSFLIKYHA